RLAGHRIYDSRQLAQPNYAAGRYVGDVRPTGERQQGMFAETGERNVLLEDHLFVIDLEGLSQQDARIEVHSLESFGDQPGNTGRCVDQTIAVRVLTNGEQQLAHGGANPGLIDCRGALARQMWPGSGRRLIVVNPLAAFQSEFPLSAVPSHDMRHSVDELMFN